MSVRTIAKANDVDFLGDPAGQEACYRDDAHVLLREGRVGQSVGTLFVCDRCVGRLLSDLFVCAAHNRIGRVEQKDLGDVCH